MRTAARYTGDMENSRTIGIGTALGIIIGTVLFAVFDYPAWIAFGLIIGAALGSAAPRLREQLDNR